MPVQAPFNVKVQTDSIFIRYVLLTLLSFYALLASLDAKAQTIDIISTGAKTFNIQLGGVYGWQIYEKIGSNSVLRHSGGSGGPFTHPFTRGAGTYTFYLHNCFPNGSCSTSPDKSITIVDTPPTISNITDRVISEDSSTGDIPFSIGDVDNAIASLTVTTSSSNTEILPIANIVLGGSGASRTINVTPLAGTSGSSTVTVRVSDGVNTVTDAFLVTVNPKNPTANREVSSSNFDIYIGDVNSDGTSDYYFHGKPITIILHGDIATPIVILSPPSFLVLGAGSSYSTPQIFRAGVAKLATLRKGVENADYYIWSDGVSGQSKVLLRGAATANSSLLLVSSASTSAPVIGQVFLASTNPNLSNRSIGIGFGDFNLDGRKDIDVNGYTYLSNSSGTINSAPIARSTAPASVSAQLNFMTGVPMVAWQQVTNAVSYEVREMLNGSATGATKTVNGTNANFGELVYLGTYTYEVRACQLVGGAPNCSDWRASNGVASPLSVAPVIDSTTSTPLYSAKGIFAVAWTRVTGATRYELYENEVLIQSSKDWTIVFSGFSAKAPGTYRYQVRACKVVCGPLSTIATTIVSSTAGTNKRSPTGTSNISIEKSPYLTNGTVDSLPIMDAPGAPVGTLAGQFRVNESGAATFKVPVVATDGVAGVTPRVSIEYSSQAMNGLVGKSWSISGLSAITRCRQTLSQDQKALAISFTETDRFCLDGQRLVVTSGAYGHSGSTYKTEIDAYQTVTAVGGTNGNPDYFTVESKDGSIATYGDSGNDNAEIQAGSATLNWSIKRFKDNVGNPIVYVYEGGLTDFHISEIRYAYGVSKHDTAHGAKISFAYESRTDETRGYIAGFETRTTKRLKKVASYNGNNLVRLYDIGYDYAPASIGGYSRVISLKECSNENLADTHCYKPTTFSWKTPTAPGTYSQTLGSVSLDSGKVTVTNRTYLDINGNGILDYLWSDKNGKIRYAVDAGAVSSSAYIELDSVGTSELPVFEPIDYNGDAHQDLIMYRPNENKWVLFLATRNANGWVLVRHTDAMPFATAKFIKVGDVNSDGLSDVIATEADSTSPVFTIYKLGRTSNAVTSNKYYSFSTAGQQSLSSTFTFGPNASQPGVVIDEPIRSFESFSDFNGDGRTDILATVEHHAWYSDMAISEGMPQTVELKYTTEVFLQNADGSFVSPTILNLANGNSGYIKQIHSPDLNGDNLPDVAYLSNNAWKYRLNNGKTFNAAVTLYVAGDKYSKNMNLAFPDLNHDGYADAVWRDSEFVVTSPGVYNHESETYEGVVAGDVITLYAKYWNPGAAAFTSTSVISNNADKNYNYTYMDVNGDTWVDQIATGIYGKTATTNMSITGQSIAGDYNASGVIPADQIQSITDGLGNSTTISYEPLGRSSHYEPIGGIKILGTTIRQCRPEMLITTAGSGATIPATCSDVTTYDINTAPYYTLLNNPFADFIGISEGAIETSDLVDAPVLEVNGPVQVVTRVESTSPAASETTAGAVDASNKNSVEYFYKHLRMQAAGRGILGFEYVTSVDMQTGVNTKTRYRQDWPYVGSPASTVVKTAGGIVLSETKNVWKRKSSANNGVKRFQPYLAKTIETVYSLDSAGVVSVAPVQTVTTETLMSDDDDGNVKQLKITTASGPVVMVKTTDNVYSTDPWVQRMGRLTSSTVTTTLQGEADTVRSVAFDYYPRYGSANGLLWKERVLEGTSDYLTTVYSYDSFGNPTQVSVTGKADATRTETRTTTYGYSADGRYKVSTTNDLSQSSSILERDSVSGLPKVVSDINGVTAQVYYDGMGKEYLKIDATGAWTRTDTKYCAGNCPSGARYFTLTRVAGGGQGTTYFDSLGRPIRSDKVGFKGEIIHVDTEYDRLGRTKRQSTPYFDGNAPAGWTVNNYDMFGRIMQVTMPDLSATTNVYSNIEGGTSVTTTNALGHSRTETRNGLGQLTVVTDSNPSGGSISYAYNTNGALKTATTRANDVAGAITVRMCYDLHGRKIGMLDPDKGAWLATHADCSQLPSNSSGWWTYSYNAFGELIAQKDAKNQTTLMYYDVLGRMIKRLDEDQTRWFYDQTMEDGNSPAGSKGKLMAVVVRKNTMEIVGCTSQDNCTQYYYDQHSRLTDTLVLLPNDTTGYITSTAYDSIGRPYEQRDALNGAVFTDSGVQTQYNQFGYPYRTVDIAPVNGGTGVLSTIKAIDAMGHVTEELRGNGATTVNTYNSKTGLLERQYATNALGFTVIQDETYGWDTVGNLKFRVNKSANVGSTATRNLSESFCYDGLNRLSASWSGQANIAAVCPTTDVTYDGFGNITKKVGVGDYKYGTNAGPHAVTKITLGAVVTNFAYDANGNMTQDTDRTLTYTSYDMLSSISKGGNTTYFKYGADHSRWQRVDVKGGVTTTTTYLGNIERIQRSDVTDVEWRRNVGGVIYTYKTNAANQLLSGATNTAFVYNDHLGSVDVITDAVGKVTHAMSFDPWGARRTDTWGAMTDAQRVTALAVGNSSVFRQPITNDGFTGHEMVDDMGIIHMNGRIYDAKIARFLQADPYIQAANDTQSYNRYSYVQNNPLNATDPSGYFSLRPFVGLIVGVALSMACWGACAPYAMMIGAAAGAAQAAANGGNVAFGAMTGIISGMINVGISSYFNVSGGEFWSMSAQGGAGHIFMSAMVGGVLGTFQGGKFGNGFITAGFGTAFGGGNGHSLKGAASSMIAGGTASVLTGGKFANGAQSAGFAYMLGWAGNKIRAGGIVAQQEISAPSSDNSGGLSTEPARSLAMRSLAKAKSALQQSSLSKNTLGNLKHMFHVSPGDPEFASVVNDLLKTIDSSIEGLKDANLLPADAQSLQKVSIDGIGFTNAQIEFALADLHPATAAFVFAGDSNKNIFLTKNFYYKNDFRRANTLIHEVSHFHPDGVSGGLTHPGDLTAENGPNAAKNSYNFSNFISTYSN